MNNLNLKNFTIQIMEAENEIQKINVYLCHNRHYTFTSEPVIPEWTAPFKISCSKCGDKAESCYFPEGIQDRYDLVELKFFRPSDYRQIQHSLEKLRPHRAWTIGDCKRILDSLQITKQFFYIKIK